MSIARGKKNPTSPNSRFVEGCVSVYLEIPASICLGNRYLCFDVDFLSEFM